MPTDDELRDLIPQIEKIARRTANRLNASGSVRDELAADAVSHVFGVIQKFDPGQSTFPTWCSAVLRNHCVTLIRREASRRKLVKRARGAAEEDERRAIQAGPAPTALEVAEAAAEEARLRPRFDIAKILEQHLQPIDRLMLATYAGVLSACGADVVNRWCHEAHQDQATMFRGIESLPKTQRKQALATMLGERVGWVRQRIFRAVQRLKNDGLAEFGA